jgi:hypothetical protein
LQKIWGKGGWNILKIKTSITWKDASLLKVNMLKLKIKESWRIYNDSTDKFKNILKYMKIILLLKVSIVM